MGSSLKARARFFRFFRKEIFSRSSSNKPLAEGVHNFRSIYAGRARFHHVSRPGNEDNRFESILRRAREGVYDWRPLGTAANEPLGGCRAKRKINHRFLPATAGNLSGTTTTTKPKL